MARSTIYPPSVQPGIPALGKKPNGWIQTTFGDVLEQVQRPAKLIDDAKYQLVVAKRSRGGIAPRDILFGRDVKTETQYFIAAGDFLISKRQIIHGACGVVPPELDGAVVSNEYATLHPTDDLLLDYLNYFSHTIYFQQTCFHASVGVDVEKMIFRLPEWFRYEIYLPPLAEQRKIAAILSTWDEAITLTGQLIAALQRRKQALMQLLLTGAVRFPEFEDEWAEVQVKDLGKVYSGGTPDTGNPDYWDGEILWCTPTEITALFTKYIRETQRRITEEGLENSSATLLEPNSILVCTRATVGQMAINLVPMATNQGFKNLTPSDANNAEFLYYLLSINKHLLVRLANGSTFLELSKGDFEALQFSIPDKSEQIQIAKVLDACDQEIEYLKSTQTQLATQKRGLMQQLLTGVVRVHA